jgi:hypothetical protein
MHQSRIAISQAVALRRMVVQSIVKERNFAIFDALLLTASLEAADLPCRFAPNGTGIPDSGLSLITSQQAENVTQTLIYFSETATMY